VSPIIDPPGAEHGRPAPFRPTYVARRSLGPRDLATAGGIAAGVATVVFYLASLWLQRTPLEPSADEGGGRPRGRPPRAPR
jgi:hypothetical protein